MAAWPEVYLQSSPGAGVLHLLLCGVPNPLYRQVSEPHSIRKNGMRSSIHRKFSVQSPRDSAARQRRALYSPPVVATFQNNHSATPVSPSIPRSSKPLALNTPLLLFYSMKNLSASRQTGNTFLRADRWSASNVAYSMPTPSSGSTTVSPSGP